MIAAQKLPAAQIVNVLETQMDVRLDGLERACRMVIAGIVALQHGAGPEEVGEKVESVRAMSMLHLLQRQRSIQEAGGE